MERSLLIIALAAALAGCSSAATSPSGATPTASAAAMATVAQTPTAEPTSTPTPSDSLPPLITPGPPAAPSPKPTRTATPKPTLVACPIVPVTIDEIAGLTPERGLACFGSSLLTFEAYVPPHPYGIGDTRDYSLSPAWLNGLGGSVVGLTAGPDAGIIVLANVPPALGRCDSTKSIPECPFRSFEGRRVLVSARFDDPVARTCRAVSIVEGSTFTDAEAVAECRRLLVVQSVGTGVPSALPTGSG